MNVNPLSWPEGWDRTPPVDRVAASFGRRVLAPIAATLEVLRAVERNGDAARQESKGGRNA